MNKTSIATFFLLFSLFALGCYNKVREHVIESEILIAFTSLNTALVERGDVVQEKNRELNQQIVSTVQQEIATGNEEHAYLLTGTGEISNMTTSLLQYIQELKVTLKSFAGWDPLRGSLENPNERDQSIAFMMGNDPEANGGSGNGEAYQLKPRLEKYLEEVENWSGVLAEPGRSNFLASLEPVFTLPSEDIALVNDPERAAMSWEMLKFGQGPVVASLATCESLRLKILEMEANQLTFLSEQFGSFNFKIDSLILVGTPVLKVKAAGMNFESKRFEKFQSDSLAVDSVETDRSK